jgi:hypothetical protein
LILFLFSLVDWRPTLFVYGPLRALGESPLLIYVLHLAMIEYTLSARWWSRPIPVFTGVYGVLSFILVLVAYGLRGLKSRWVVRPYALRVLLGA